jgi:hypothetical protein
VFEIHTLKAIRQQLLQKPIQAKKLEQWQNSSNLPHRLETKSDLNNPKLASQVTKAYQIYRLQN